MASRAALRPLAATPGWRAVDVVLGHTADGTRQANIDPGTYRGKPIPLRDPAAVRSLIADLGEALAWLEGADG